MGTFSRLVVLAFVMGGAPWLAMGQGWAKTTPEQRCQAGKDKAAGKYAACRANAEARLVTSGDTSKNAAALNKCATTFVTAWQKLEDKAAKAGAPCPANDTTIRDQTDAYTHRVAALVGGNRFVDNGDGTVTDQQTGLQWEKKTTAVGSGTNYADPHDVDNIYKWNLTYGDTTPNGTVFTDFLDKLNGGLGANTCLARHCDWQLPTADELRTILLDAYPCGASPCIDPIFGPTVAFYYWSTTTIASNPILTWVVYFDNGSVYFARKDYTNYVRAVRAGP